MRRKNVDMLNGPIGTGLLALAFPIMLMNVMNSLFNILDMDILGDYVGDSAVGAVGACGTLITLCTCLISGLATGANINVAKRIGQKDPDIIHKAMSTSMYTGLVSSVLFAIIGIVMAPTFLRWANCPEKLMDGATLYFRLYFIGYPFNAIYSFANGILRATGDSRRPMYFVLGSAVVKVLANVVLIIGFGAGVEGAGIAGIIANMVACALSIYGLYTGVYRFRIREMTFSKTELKDILHLGIPTGLQSAGYALANVLIAATVNSFGPDATTGVSIANQFDGMLYNICLSPAVALSPYMAQNVGARNFKRAKKSLLYGVGITTLIGGGLGALSAIFSQYLAGTMSSTPAVIEYACQKMIIISSTYFICGINEAMAGAMRGIGKPIVPTIATLLFMCALRFVWVYFIFPLFPNLSFLYLVWPIGWILCIAMLLAVYIPSINKMERQALSA